MKKYSLLGALAAAFLLTACAQTPQKPRILWPIPPDEPKLEFIGVYASPNDFPKTAGEKRLAKLVGDAVELSFASPFGIAADGRGRVYVSDIHLHNVRVFDFNQNTADLLSKTSVFQTPMGVAVDGDGNVYVADAAKKVVAVFSPEGVFLRSFGQGVLTKPVYLALNRRLGRLYVSNPIQESIAVFDLQGKHLFSFGKGGGGNGEFFGVQGIAIDAKDEVFVADQYNTRVQSFDADGNFLHAFGELGDQMYQFESPKDLAFDSEGNLHVVDGRRPYISAYTPEGRLLLTTGSGERTSAPLGFGAPRSIYIDQNDRIYVTDLLNKRFAVWQYLSAAYLKEHPITDEDRARLQQYLDEQARKAKGQAKEQAK